MVKYNGRYVYIIFILNENRSRNKRRYELRTYVDQLRPNLER